MARQFRIFRNIATVPVQAGNFATVDLPRGYDYETLFVRLTGGVQVTTLFAGGVRAEAPCQAISRLEVIADGRNTLHSAPMWFDTLGSYDRRALNNGARYTTPPSAATVATYQVEALASIDFMLIDGVRAKDSNLVTQGYQLFQLRMTFGNPADLFGPGAGVGVFNNLNAEVFSSELVEIPSADGTRSLPITAKKVSYQEIPVPSSNVNQEVRLPAGNLIKSVLVRTEGQAVAGEPSIAMLNTLNVFSGVDVRMRLSGGQVRMKNNQDYGYMFPGYYVFDAMNNGTNDGARLTEAWDVTNQAEPKIAVDIVGGTNNKMQTVVTEFLAIPQGA